MKTKSLKLSLETLSKLISLGGELASESEVMQAYESVLPELIEESEVHDISENIPDNLRPMANALYGAISTED